MFLLSLSPTATTRMMSSWPWTFGTTFPTTYAKPWQDRIYRYISVLSPYLLVLIPRYMRKDGLLPTKQPHITSYLDALRGIAAMIVLNHHHMPYNHTWLVQQPFFCLLISGRGSEDDQFFYFLSLALTHLFSERKIPDLGVLVVDVFFVISGYVLSFRILKLMRNRQTGHLLDSMASAVFRRYIRLYASAGIASFISMIWVRLHWAEPTHRTETLFSQLNDWAKDFGYYSNPFVDLKGFWFPGVFSSRYLDPLWTIPVEYRGSLSIYLFCMASCKLSNRNRMLLCSLLIICCYMWAVVYPALFLGGLFLADLSFSRHPERLYLPPSLPQNTNDAGSTSKTTPLYERVFFSCMLVSALFLLGQPSGDLSTATWPWPYFEKCIPKQYHGSGIKEHFWLSIGSLMLVFALDSYSTLQTPLKWNFSQYLGQVSFGIYVMHIIIVWSFWKLFLNPWRVRLLGEGKWTFAPCLLINYAMVLWAAELFIKIDDRVIKFGKWLQDRLFEW